MNLLINFEYLKIAGWFSFIASALHIAVIIGGASWYRFFGAGENMAFLAEQGSYQPAIITFCITLVLAVCGAYAWSGAGILPTFPFLKIILVLITAVYLIRGALGLCALFFSNHPQVSQKSSNFWIWSSLICLVIGLTHLKGVLNKWWS